MKLHVITNNVHFFRAIHELARGVHPGLKTEHVSEEAWIFMRAGDAQNGDVLISDGLNLEICDPEQNLRNAFAVVGTVCHNNDEVLDWNWVSRNDFVLRLRELSPMTTENVITEDVVVQSSHVRLARFRIPTCCKLIPALRDRLLTGLRDYHVVEGTMEHHFCMALEEALNNAFYHGNLEISSELKEDGSSRFIELARERELLSPWCNRYVYVTELVSAFGLWITIQDEGKGFNVKAALERCDDPEALLASGRGLLLMRGFSDEVFFNNQGNEVTLVLYAEGEDRELPLGTCNSPGNETRLVLS